MDDKIKINFSKCVDIIMLASCCLTHLYDLQDYLESTNSNRHEKKRALNRAIKVADRLVAICMQDISSTKEMRLNNNQMCAIFEDGLYNRICLQGVEREMNIVLFCVERIMKYSNDIIASKVVRSPIPYQVREIVKIPAILSPFSFERYDLSLFINQQLQSMYKERNYE